MENLSLEQSVKVIVIPAGGQIQIEINVPEKEKIVLQTLRNLGEAIAPDIVRAANNKISLAAIYQLLKRLVKRGIVSKREEFFEIGGLKTRRVFYSINRGVNIVMSENQSIEVTSGGNELSFKKVKTELINVFNIFINTILGAFHEKTKAGGAVYCQEMQ